MPLSRAVGIRQFCGSRAQATRSRIAGQAPRPLRSSASAAAANREIGREHAAFARSFRRDTTARAGLEQPSPGVKARPASPSAGEPL
jgi:hypothetical protein